MAFYLADDGTLDTVVTCDTCGAEERYTFDGWTDAPGQEAYDAFVAWALEDAAELHDCIGRYCDVPARW
jgi:hypothetical protein